MTALIQQPSSRYYGPLVRCATIRKILYGAQEPGKYLTCCCDGPPFSSPLERPDKGKTAALKLTEDGDGTAKA